MVVDLSDQNFSKAWLWTEVGDPQSWLPTDLEQILHRNFESVLTFQSCDFKGESSSFFRKNKPVLFFEYDLTLKNCTFVGEDRDQVPTFDVAINNFSQVTDLIEVEFLEYSGPVSEKDREFLHEQAIKSISELCNHFNDNHAKKIEEKIKQKNGSVDANNTKPSATTTNGMQSTNGTKKAVSSKFSTYEYSNDFSIDPNFLFKCFTDPATIQQLTQHSASFDLQKDSDISYLNGNLFGKVLDFEDSKHLLLQLKMQDWAENLQFSEFYLQITSSSPNSFKMKITHSKIPSEHYESISRMWQDVFLSPICRMCGMIL